MLRCVSLTLAIACSLVLLRIGLTAPRRLPINYNEGWNAYHQAALIAGQPLYPSPAGFFLTNYPPLSFYIVAAAGVLVGDVMLAGRLLSLLAFAIWTIALAATARLLRCSASESAFAAVLFAVHMLVFIDYYVGVNDPQIMAHAIASLAVPLLLREPRTRWSLFPCALLLVVSVFTKHNLVVMPIACVAWLMIFDRRAAWMLSLYGAVLAILALAACVALFGPGFVEHVLSPRGYTLGKLASMSAVWVPRMAVPLAGLAILLRRVPRDRQAAFAILLAAIATFIGLLSLGANGVFWNAMFDADWALCLAAAIALNRLAPAGLDSQRLRIVTVAAYLAIPLGVVASRANVHWGSPRYWLDPRWSEAASAARDIEFFEQHPGPALCEDLAFCYWAGKAAEVDFFNMQERIHREPSRGDELVRLVEARHYGAVQLDTPGRDLGARFRDALERHYRVDHVEQWGAFLVPR
jgi:hypothetical protein